MKLQGRGCPAVLLLALGISAFAGKALIKLPFTPEGRIQYREVIDLEGVPAAEIMRKVRLWVGKAYQSAPNVIKTDEGDTLIVKGTLPVPYKMMGVTGSLPLEHTLTFEAKDGRARVTMTDLAMSGVPLEDQVAPDGSQKRSGYERVLVGIPATCEGLMAQIRAELNTPEDSW